MKPARSLMVVTLCGCLLGVLGAVRPSHGQCVPDPPTGSRAMRTSIACGDLSMRAADPSTPAWPGLDVGLTLRSPLVAIAAWRPALVLARMSAVMPARVYAGRVQAIVTSAIRRSP